LFVVGFFFLPPQIFFKRLASFKQVNEKVKTDNDEVSSSVNDDALVVVVRGCCCWWWWWWWWWW